MNNDVYVYFKNNSIAINNDMLVIDSVSIESIKELLPENIDPSKVSQIVWTKNTRSQTYFNYFDGSCFLFDTTEENFNLFVKPYVDLWEHEKERIQQEIEEENNDFTTVQMRALSTLNQKFDSVSESAYLISSLGFKADANRVAKDNVQGLIEEVGNGTVSFCDYDNNFHTLDKVKLETLRSEINKNGQNLYAQKWQYRDALQKCETVDEVQNVVDSIGFNYTDFSTNELGLAKVGI